MPICASCGQDNPDVAKFCLACGAPLAAQPTTEERKLITVLFTDIVGSTAKAEHMDPEDVRARLAPYYVRLRTELERFGGTVEKFIGDAVVALFGAPVSHEDDPERAVRAAFAVCRAIDELNAEDEWLDLQVRVGVNTGEALIVVGARASEGEGVASGDVMNTAARIQSAAPVDGVLVGELTYAATRDAIDYRDAEPIAAKGKSEPVRVWEAVQVKEEAHMPAADAVTFVGREREASALAEVWSTTIAEHRAGLVTIVGPPGIGKSRLLAEFARRAGQEGRVHWGRCLPYGEGITYWPVTDVVKSAAGILQSDDRATIAGRLDDFLKTLPTDDLDELRTIAAALSNLIGSPTTPHGTYATAEISQGELHWGIRRMLQLLASQEPTALILEDLHWAEPTLLDLIAYIIAPDDIESRLAIVCSTRPELAETSPGFLGTDGRRRTIELGTLDSEQAAALLTDLLGDPALAKTPLRIVADHERRRKSPVPRGDGADAPRPRPHRRGALAKRGDGRATGPDERPGPDQLEARSARRRRQAPGAQRSRRRRGLLGGRGRAPRHRRRGSSTRSPRGPEDARAAGLRPAQRRLDGRWARTSTRSSTS